jgi:hypothetical protein
MGTVGLLRAAGFIVDRCNRCLEPGTDLASRAATRLAVTYRTLVGRGKLLPIIGLAVLTSLVLQVVLEFGPLWLVNADRSRLGSARPLISEALVLQ